MDRILIRSAVVRVVFVVLFLLVAMAASAHASTPGEATASATAPLAAQSVAPSPAATPVSGAPAAPPAAPETWVAGALYSASPTDHGLAWGARWVLTPEAAADVAGGERRLVRFAVPLAEAARLEPTRGVAPVVEGGRVTGILVDSSGLVGRTVSAIVREPAPRNGLGAPLGAPVARGTALQILDVDLGSGARLEVEPGLILERRVGYLAPPGTSHGARDEAQRLTGYAPHLNGAVVYVRGDDVSAARGLRGAIVTARARTHAGTLGVGVVFGAIVIALVAAVKRLRHAASVERADALLAADFAALDGASPAPRAPEPPLGADRTAPRAPAALLGAGSAFPAPRGAR